MEICEVILNDDVDGVDSAHSADTVVMKAKDDVTRGGLTIDVTSTPVKVRPLSAVHYVPATPLVIPSKDSEITLPTSLPASPAATITGPLLAATGLAWFGEHTIVLISKRKGSRFCLEIMSREVSKGTHSLSHSLTYSLTRLLTHLLTHSLTYLLTHSPTHSPTHSLTHLLTYSLTRLLTHLLTHSLTYSLTHLLTYSLTLTHSLTQGSLAAGKPSPAVHKIIPFPPGWCPKSLDLRSYNPTNSSEVSCYIAVGTGNHFVMFHVRAILRGPAKAASSPRGLAAVGTVQDYVLFKLWEVNVSSIHTLREGSALQLQVPVRKTLVSIANIAVKSNKFIPFPVLFILDNDGRVWEVHGKVPEMSVAYRCEVVSEKERYFDMNIVTDAFAHSFPRFAGTLPPASTPSTRIAEVLLLQSRLSYESQLLLRVDNYCADPACNEAALVCKSLFLPVPSIPLDAIPFGFTSGIRLSIRYNDSKPACILNGIHDDNASKFRVLTDVLPHWQAALPLGNLGNLVVEQVTYSLTYSPYLLTLLTYSLTHSLTHLLTRLLTHSPTHSLTGLLTHSRRTPSRRYSSVSCRNTLPLRPLHPHFTRISCRSSTPSSAPLKSTN